MVQRTDQDRPRDERESTSRERELEQDDGTLVAAYARGEDGAFERVEGWIRSAVRRRYARMEDEIDDLCQTVHEKLLTNLREGRFRGQSSLRTYVTSISLYTAIDRLRHLYQQRALTDSLDERPDGPAGSNPYGRSEQLDEAKLLHQVLQSLPARCRELWGFVFVERLSYDEIGSRLSIPTGTVKSRMWHCRRQATALFRRFREQGRGH